MAARRRGRSSARGRVRRSGPVTVELVGMDELRQKLQELGPNVKLACFRALKESAAAVVDHTKAAVRKDTGNLQESVKARFRNNELRAEIGWWDRDDNYAIYHELGTRRFPPKPSLGPALEAERNKIGGRIAAEIRKELS
ncbi:HK97-gp10 family putative phage morphogenesis protein [Streptomyces sp. NPDC058992]|uniref:HK97-gp10 family putative phage morphogenesis protein n=1 Tax=Streptomyces sp. NPDC058992 TaxID=3346688 RepID=UPI0036B2419A